MTMLLSAFPNQYSLDIQERIIERFNARAAALKYQAYYTVQSTDQYQHISDKVSSFTAMPTWGDGANITLDSPENMGTYTMTQTGYGLAFKAGRHLVRYGLLNTINQWADALADSAFNTLRTKHASVLNNGFSTSYAYREASVALISASHTTAGSTRSNILAAATALSFAAYDALRQVASAHVDYRGKLAPIVCDQLIVPDELAVTALQLKGSVGQPDTTDNNMNPFYNQGGVIVDEYLTSATAWFIRDSMSHNLLSLVGLPFTPGMYLEDASQSLVHFAQMDFAYGADDWVGILGSAGA